MKKLILFVAFLGLVSCSSDDNGGSSADASEIVGIWKPTALAYSGTSVYTAGGESFTTNFSAVALDFHDCIINFNQNGTLTSVGEGYTVELTMEMMGQEMTQEMFVGSFFQSGTWEINGNTLILTNTEMEEPVEYQIIESNSTTLKLQLNNFHTPMDGGHATLNGNMTLTRM
jgi:hypothetical protein